MSVVSDLPGVDDVLALPTLLLETAPREWEDGNGHVNVRHFYDLHMRAAHSAMTAIGLDNEYRETTGQSVFSVEQHIRFLGEVHVGDEVSVHMRWVERGDKVLHAVSFIVNRSTRRLVNTLEALEAHVDLRTRRACSWAPAVADRIDEVTEAHGRLPWMAPVGGAIIVRR